jgi:hypothetical protein
MRLYHSRCEALLPVEFFRAGGFRKVLIYLFGLILSLALLTACVASQPQPAAKINIRIFADGKEETVQVSPGSAVREALSQAGLTVGSLDRVEPPLFTFLNENIDVHLIRVREEFSVEQQVIPFEHQVLRNESMPQGETRLVQPGVNGKSEITYRRLFEDGKEVANNPVKTVILQDAVPEIVMVGSQAPFASFSIPGRLVYILGGNAWLIDGNTGNRKPVITTADLDGRIFSLSPDGEWLLYSRKETKDGNINSLWAVKLDGSLPPVDLQVYNVVHFAEWRPEVSYQIAYSTVEPRSSAPGWQANNDLNLLKLSGSGQVMHLPVELETNMGGNYGWWGMTYAWSPDGLQIVYTRPDGIGFLLLGEEGQLNPLLNVIPFQTGGDWAWVPGISWSPDGRILYSIDHVPPAGSTSPETSPDFDLEAVPLYGAPPMRLVSQTGMFAYPKASRFQDQPDGGQGYQVAYLQAIFPSQSDSSRYRLMVMDQDGSNRRSIFPDEGASGIQPQAGWGVWSPAAIKEGGSLALAVIYQNNLWLVDASSGEARQLTGDGLVNRVDWK